VQLCQLYDLPMGGPGARRLLQRLSGHNALIGGAQLGIQAALSGVRQLLMVAAPFTAGLSLAPAAPVALAQAALAVHTTRRTGRLTARWLLEQKGRGKRSRPLPATLLRRLAWQDSTLQRLLAEWPQPLERTAVQELLP
jgi:GTP-binding protein Era